MKLNSARQAWHDCYHQSWDSVMAVAVEWAKLGTSVQTTDRGITAGQAAHQALAGRVQLAIDTLQPRFKAFGNYLYSPIATIDDRETAEFMIWEWVMQRQNEAGVRMTAAKAERTIYVSSGVLYRYRRMNQGGQGSMPDPLESPEGFRAALYDTYGVKLDSRNWERDWQPFIEACFGVCNDIDRQALWPVAGALGLMLEAA